MMLPAASPNTSIVARVGFNPISIGVGFNPGLKIVTKCDVHNDVCLILSCLILSCLCWSCLVLLHLVLNCHSLSYLVEFFFLDLSCLVLLNVCLPSCRYPQHHHVKSICVQKVRIGRHACNPCYTRCHPRLPRPVYPGFV